MVSKYALALLTFCWAGQAVAGDMRFVALGDMPYGKPEKVYPLYETLIETINTRDPDLVIHVGDTKSGKSECSDAYLDEQRAYLDMFEAPTLYTPGDNEWTDCHRRKAGGYEPLERLSRIRSTYFDTPDTPFGKAGFTLTHQGDRGFPENARLMLDGVMIVTAHVVGSNNGFEVRSATAVAEYFKRDAANILWLGEAFDAAVQGGADALVLAIHADMFEFDFNEGGDRKWLRHSGFRNFGTAFHKRAKAFGKPILLVFGDSHRHRVFRPFPKKAPNVTALEVYGAKDMHAVEVTLRRESGGVIRFEIDTLLNPAL